jgi:hypothetical protein
MGTPRNAEIIVFTDAICRLQAGLERRRHVARIRRFALWLADCEQCKDQFRWQGPRGALEYLIAERRRAARREGRAE